MGKRRYFRTPDGWSAVSGLAGDDPTDLAPHNWQYSPHNGLSDIRESDVDLRDRLVNGQWVEVEADEVPDQWRLGLDNPDIRR